MKTIGLTRRIDDLGRIVIPKEIRTKLRIKTGENFEIFINETNNIILKKYNNMSVLDTIAKNLIIAIQNTTKKNIFLTTTEQIMYANKKENINKKISTELKELIHKRKETTKENIKIVDNEEKSIFISPIISNGDILGSIIIENKNITENDKQLIKLSTTFLSKYIED